MTVDSDTALSLVGQYAGLRATNYFGFASYVILLYDHCLTFDDEVRYIWHGKKTLVACLFIINRYLTPLGFAVNINAYTSPDWTPEMFATWLSEVCYLLTPCRCRRFVRFEGAMGYLGLAISSLIMSVRVTAIYYGHRAVVTLMAAFFLALLGVNVWLLSSGNPVPHLPGLHSCTMVFGPKTKDWASISAWLPLAYDTVVIVLVIARTRAIIRTKTWGRDPLVTTLISDGLIYYSVIVAANVMLGIMIGNAPVEIRNIGGQFQVLITVTMISRITLNIRRRMDVSETSTLSLAALPITQHANARRRNTSSGSEEGMNIQMYGMSTDRLRVDEEMQDVINITSSRVGTPEYAEELDRGPIALL